MLALLRVDETPLERRWARLVYRPPCRVRSRDQHGPHHLLVKMNPHATLVCPLPNVRVFGNLIHLLLHKDFECTDWEVRDRTRLRFFTKKSRVRFFTDRGLQVERSEAFNPITSPKSFVPLALLQLLGHGDTRFMQLGAATRV